LTVTFLFASLILQAATGLTRAGIDLYYPPVGPIIAAFIAKPGVDSSQMTWRNNSEFVDGHRYSYIRPIKFAAGTIHRYNAYLLIGLIVLHILTSVLTEVRQTSGVVSAMFSGRVRPAGPEARRGGSRADRESAA
jgi:cytochrome b